MRFLLALLFASQVSGQTTPATTPTPLRLRLHELLDRDEPPARLEIDGRIFAVRDLQKRAKAKDASVTEVVVFQLLRERLQTKGHYLGDDDFAKAYASYVKKYETNAQFAEMMATRFRGYPSVESYRRWCRLWLSFERSIAKGIKLDVLEKHVRSASCFLSEERRVVTPVFFSARKNGRWDFAGALRRARAACARLEKDEGEGFAAVAKTGDALPVDPSNRKWTGSHGLVDFRFLFGESDYTDRVYGVSAVRGFFYALAIPGEVSEPIRGPHGYWIVRFGKHHPWKHRNFTLEVDDRQAVARRQYVEHRFRKWMRDVLAKVVLKEPRPKKK